MRHRGELHAFDANCSHLVRIVLVACAGCDAAGGLSGRRTVAWLGSARGSCSLGDDADQASPRPRVRRDIAARTQGYDLAAGDIEEIAGQPCIRCPWHGKEFCIASGREMVGRRELSSEQKQRTHRVTVEQDGYLWCAVLRGSGLASPARVAFGRFSALRQPTTSAGVPTASRASLWMTR